jgi:biotin synthase
MRKCFDSELQLHLYYSMSDRGNFPTQPDLSVRGAAQAELHGRAAEVARAQFGRRVFIRGVVEISNFCRQNCSYCGMLRDNRLLARYRARLADITDLLVHHCPGSITDINIQAGEDPVAVREIAIPLIRTLSQETSLGISVCLGTLSADLYRDLKTSGATIYIMKFESADAAHYNQLNAPGSLEERVRNIRHLANTGWMVSSGFIAGLPGQCERDLIDNLELASRLPLRGCSVSPFIVGENTPLSEMPAGDPEWTFNCMAMLRLMRPDWVIPAVSALNLAAKEGYRRGLRVGANLVTINLTPPELRRDYVIYTPRRFIMTEERALSAIAAEGMEPCPQSLANYCRDGFGAKPTQPAGVLVDRT